MEEDEGEGPSADPEAGRSRCNPEAGSSRGDPEAGRAEEHTEAGPSIDPDGPARLGSEAGPPAPEAGPEEEGEGQTGCRKREGADFGGHNREDAWMSCETAVYVGVCGGPDSCMCRGIRDEEQGRSSRIGIRGTWEWMV